jgi:hypothetical protein
LAEGQKLQPPSIAVRRDVYETVGGFDEGIRGAAEDWEMWTRVATHTEVWYDPRILAVYRVRPGSLSDPSHLKRNMRDTRRVLRLNAKTLTPVLGSNEVRIATRAARRSIALSLLRRGERAIGQGKPRSVGASMFEAIRLHASPRVFVGCSLLLARWLRRRVRLRLEGAR